MRTQTVDLHDDDIDATIVVVRARLAESNERTRLIMEVERQVPHEDMLIRFAKKVTLPALIAATREVTIALDGQPVPWPLTFDDLARLPDELIERWIEAVYGLNPHWQPGGDRSPDQAALEKKAPTSTGA